MASLALDNNYDRYHKVKNNKFKRTILNQLLYCCFLLAPATLQAQQKNIWWTHWNGISRNKSDPLKQIPSEHFPENFEDFSWELTSLFNGKKNVSANNLVPIYKYNRSNKKLTFSKSLASGTKINIKKIMNLNSFHYFGIILSSDSDQSLHWVSAAFIKKSKGNAN